MARFVFAVLAVVLAVCVLESHAGTCSVGRLACVASCMAQNCATGYCHDGPNGVCSCTRCSKGPIPWPRRNRRDVAVADNGGENGGDNSYANNYGNDNGGGNNNDGGYGAGNRVIF